MQIAGSHVKDAQELRFLTQNMRRDLPPKLTKKQNNNKDQK